MATTLTRRSGRWCRFNWINTLIVLVAALGTNRVIGIDGQLPWHLSTDLRRFKQLTLGSPVIMGRITYESIGKPLVDRTNIVMTSNPEFSAPGIHVANSKEQALTIADEHLGSGGRIHIIGGGEVYRQFLENADGMELTVVDAAPEGDAYFPEWDDSEWEIVAATPHPAVPPSPAYEFRSLIRLVT